MSLGATVEVKHEESEEFSLKSLRIEKIIASRDIHTRWQPISSIKSGNIVGYEALSYGLTQSGRVIPPDYLFSMAEERRSTLELDRLCRERAVENFALINSRFPNTTLFMNLDTSIIDRGVVGSGHLIRSVEKAGLNPGQIVVEVIESKTSNLKALKEFIDTYRAHGFLIALDDVGAGHSNLDRIAQIKPDIIKIDRLLTESVGEYHAREVFRALTNLAHATGSLVVAEGIETKEQSLYALELGADLLQGYYLARPQEVTDSFVESVTGKTMYLATCFRDHVLTRLRNKTELFAKHQEILHDIQNAVEQIAYDEFDNVLKQTIQQFPSVEYAYILSESGVQVSHTIGQLQEETAPKHFLYEPASPGTDHGLKEYVLILKSGNETGVTEPYISLATGNLCQTYSSLFTSADNRSYILCVDVTSMIR